MNTPRINLRPILIAVAVRMTAVTAVWLILWHCAYPLSFPACAVLTALVLSNLVLILHPKRSDTRVTAKYLFIADGIVLPVVAITAQLSKSCRVFFALFG